MRKQFTAAHWGIYEVDLEPGAPPRIAPLADDADPSPIGLDQLDPSVTRLRITRPAVRESWLKGGPGARPDLRGREPFVEVDWDHALDLVAAELGRVRDAHGNEAIFGGSYGWSSAGRFHHAQSQVHRFLNGFGGYVRSTDSYSLGAGRVLLPHILASMDETNASHSSWELLAEHTRLFVSFGGVPLKNTQVSSGGAGRHRVRDGLAAMARAGVRFVNISPVADNMATGGAVEWIPIRPNTDTAMLLAMAHVLLTEDLLDREFLASHCVGFDRFAPYLLGEADGTAKTPAWAAEITGVPADRIASLARELAATRSIVNIAWALQRSTHGEQPFWALVALAAMLGQIGLPGGGLGLGYGAMNVMGSAHPRFQGPVLPQGSNAVKAFIPCARIADMLLHPGEPFRYNGGHHHYPHIRLVYWAGGNPFHHHQDLNRLMEAFRQPETIVVHEQYWNYTAKMADIVLPATLSLERDDIGFATREGYYIAMARAMAPQGEARDDFAIFSALSARLGFADAYTEGLDAAGWLRRIYEEGRQRARAAGIDLPGFQQFWERGLLDLSPHDKPFTMFEAFRQDPAAHPLKTPSGRIEIFSETIAAFDLDDCPGHPVWIEPAEWLGHADAGSFPLHMLSDQPARRLHGQLDPSPYSRAGKVRGREPIHISPADARRRGIADGDIVLVRNDRGRCLAGAVVSDAIMPGVVRLATGAWFDPAEDEGREPGLERHGNPNSLTLDRGSSALSQGCAAQTCLVEVEPLSGEAPEVGAFTLPDLVPLRH
ncbi:MAG: molybdopterin guanine dinucleotide-containing S/N-oxide reductase [Sphingobium sp.]